MKPDNKDKNDWIEYAARAGYSAKMVVYTLLGVLAILTAFGSQSSEQLSQKGVFQEILQQPFGRVLLGLVAAGLICYAFWRIVQAVKDTENTGDDAKGYIKRIFFVITGLIYGAGGVVAARMVTGTSSGGSGGDNTESMTARLMGMEWGLWLVGLLGALVLAFAFVQFKHAWKADFISKFRRGEMSQNEIDASCHAGQSGYAARGIVYLLIGIFFIQAAWTTDPQEAGGMKEVLQTLLQQPYGPWLLALVGAGLLAYGVFCGFEAKYRRTRLE
ncbi:MAG: hypothetical protein CME36_03170 [unclassified Hahellaceae]|nr:hypothetical protein [Hahellaceae bacterium]|tara:strand:+ start:41894 stop:42712 length:819 start_codon:yes stop_codon:yes gene_type:complete